MQKIPSTSFVVHHYLFRPSAKHQKSTNPNEEVYYEIEEIKIEEKVLGRRIFIHWNQSDVDDIHVFIPEDRD